MTTYERRRRFDATPEPEGPTGPDLDPTSASPGSLFVVHQHYATRLHRDLRLEMFGEAGPVLVSWAVPKGLPLARGVRALAIRTEDHPRGYASFSGTIPEGSYGAGEVRILDTGTYRMVDRSADRLTVSLEGRRLRGIWHLVHTGGDRWLALLAEDHRPPPDPLPPLTPMLATPGKTAFDDERWLFEPKWDGVRALAVCRGETRLLSRAGNDVTAAYPELAGLADRLVALDAVLDGEIVAFDGDRPSFERLQERMHARDRRRVERLAASTPVVFLAFDILTLDGRTVTGRPLDERRRLLEEILVPSASVQLTPSVVGEGTALYETVAARGLEGIVAKKRSSRYEPGRRSPSWVKVKTVREADVVVAGWIEGEGRRAGGIGSLVCGVTDGDRLRYVGRVGTGFTERALRDLAELLGPLERPTPPFPPDVVRSVPELRRARWVEPSVVVAVELRGLTAAGRLRAASFRGVRTDKTAAECTAEALAAGS